MKSDPHSFANFDDASVTHLHWKAHVDFEKKVISGTASWTISHRGIDRLILDTKGLIIHKITLDSSADAATYRVEKPDPVLGAPLVVSIKPDSKTVHIQYETGPDAAALQWLTPQQTSGRIFPFLFTQSQAILARSWIPCQDSPGVRFTYEADVSVPPELLPLMSASNPIRKNATGRYHFKMEQPIPSYLLALAVGDVDFKPISNRSGVYAEANILERATWEFADLEKMIAGAEALYGSYKWERYDVLVLPPSFPFGGMENPTLTFLVRVVKMF